MVNHDEFTGLRISKELLRELRQEAQFEAVSLSKLIRAILNTHVKQKQFKLQDQ